MTLELLAAIYVGVFLLIQVATSVLLRSEPTAHGQIMGRQVGCGLGLVWPIALPYLLVVGLIVGVSKLLVGRQ